MHVSDMFKFQKQCLLMKTICDNMSAVSLVICVPGVLYKGCVDEIVNGVQYQRPKCVNILI